MNVKFQLESKISMNYVYHEMIKRIANGQQVMAFVQVPCATFPKQYQKKCYQSISFEITYKLKILSFCPTGMQTLVK